MAERPEMQAGDEGVGVWERTPRSTSAQGRHSLPLTARILLTAAMLGLFGGLALAVLSLSQPALGLSAAVAERISESGVSHPVTAVLLNFRGYDTLLELVVLLLALMGTWSVGRSRGCASLPWAPTYQRGHHPGALKDVSGWRSNRDVGSVLL